MKKKDYIVPTAVLIFMPEDDVMANSSIFFPIRPMNLEFSDELEY